LDINKYEILIKNILKKDLEFDIISNSEYPRWRKIEELF
jgi:arabinogalactan endo-1,4-beta-galactosidase